MKGYVLGVLFIFLSRPCLAQKSVEEKIYSRYTGGIVRCTIWLPEDWNAKLKSTTIYTFSYGASDAEFIAEQIKYLNKFHITELPQVIVANIWGNTDVMGYNYETGLLTEKGLKTLESIKNEIIPLLEDKYNVSAFRTYIGQSYGASYGNYLFLHQPDMFSSYILMSPEKIATAQPPFELTPEHLKFYGHRRTYYFVAAGAFDLQRRQDYGEEIFRKLKELASSKFSYQYLNLSIAGHNNSLAVGLPVALDFIYQDYYSLPQPDSTKGVASLLQQYHNQLSDIYGIDINKKSYGVYSSLFPLLWEQKDSAGMMDAINYFITNESDVQQLRDFAYSCTIVGLTDRASQLYTKAIEKGLQSQRLPGFNPAPLLTAYRELAFLYNDPRAGWDTLQRALDLSVKYKDNVFNGYYPAIYYYLGKFSADHNYKVNDGLKYLQLYEKKRAEQINLNQFSVGDIYYNIGKCYVLLKDNKNARLYLQKALEANVNNKRVEALLKALDS